MHMHKHASKSHKHACMQTSMHAGMYAHTHTRTARQHLRLDDIPKDDIELAKTAMHRAIELLGGPPAWSSPIHVLGDKLVALGANAPDDCPEDALCAVTLTNLISDGHNYIGHNYTGDSSELDLGWP